MKLIDTISELNVLVESHKSKGQKIVLVPTMGALHEGHLSLLREAVKHGDIIICSIFVNPTQFNNSDDLDKYPRTIKADINALSQVQCDYVFLPQVHEMYPGGLKSKNYNLGILDQVMEGAFREGHFNGVATVVSRFFDLVKPDAAIFGEKDFQQVAVIKRMVELDEYPIEILVAPIKREENGLAMSSRNVRLSEAKRKEASCIYETMYWAKENATHYKPAELENLVHQRINANEGFEVEYVTLCNSETLEGVSEWSKNQEVQICVAVFCEGVRLIDNLSIF